MKICHMTSAHDSNDSRIFQKECVSIAGDDRFDVYLVAPGESRFEKNVNIIGVGEKPSSRIKRMLSFSKVVYREALKLDADIYHFHDPELLSVGLKLKKKGKKVIFDSHENTVEQIKIKKYLPGILRSIISRLYYNEETYICRKIDAVVFPCLVNGKNPFDGRCKQTVFINNLPFLSEFSEVDKKKPKYDICVIGSLTEERGITKLLEAVRITGCKVALAGDFSPSDYKEKLESKGLLEGVDCLGICDRPEVIELYSVSRMGASTILPVGQYPTVNNLPTKVYECMAMGLPVIISDFDYPKEVMKTYEFGICADCTNAQEIADAITKLKNDPELCEKYGKMGRKAVEEVFNWEKEVEKLVNLYLRILNSEYERRI